MNVFHSINFYVLYFCLIEIQSNIKHSFFKISYFVGKLTIKERGSGFINGGVSAEITLAEKVGRFSWVVKWAGFDVLGMMWQGGLSPGMNGNNAVGVVIKLLNG